MGFLYIAAAIGLGALLYWGPFAVPLASLLHADYLYLALLLGHLVCGSVLIAVGAGVRQRRGFPSTSRGRSSQEAGPLLRPQQGTAEAPRAFLRIPEVLFVLCLLFFLFSYIYALNANMDYVQRFVKSGGAVRLALDTRRERLTAIVRFGPLLLLNGLFYLYWRLRPRSTMFGSAFSRWALPFSLLSVLLSISAFPSFISLQGLGFLAFVALVPLFLVFKGNSLGWGLFYGLIYAVTVNMLLNFWLGTYSLVTLQLVSLVSAFMYALFLLPTLWLYKRLRRLGFLILPAAWIAFEYLRSIGFLGYPWGLWGTTQYEFLTLVQVASLTGVWGVGFVVVLINSGLAAGLGGAWIKADADGLPYGSGRPDPDFPPRPRPASGAGGGLGQLLIAAVLFLAFMVAGTISLDRQERRPVDKRVRLALVQQNADPRKHNYRTTFNTLVRLTDKAVQRDPDLVVWSETAFVPNIRRWSRVEPERHSYAALVREFLDYQKSLGRWLVTGNDDYELVVDEQGLEQRLDFNATILFDPEGRRVQTYRKIRLVPFTESFPWRKELPAFYEWLKERDVYLWEPGKQRVVFRHPEFRFATPICFEDAFPNEVRLFVKEGAEVIVNLSNDYWSLTEVEAKQHGVNSFFRAVENRTPLVRAAASGLTCYVDTFGRLRASLPYYQEAYLIVDVEIRQKANTPYNLLGDWFPQALLAVVLLFLLLSVFPKLRRSL
jgi:apolipoprotein N-acyltransferase